jgi:hypothetical protein
LIGCAVLVLAGMCASTPAHAASVDVTCAGTETVSYDPGLLLTPQAVHTIVTGILAPCTSGVPGITAGTYREDFTTPLSCATLLSGRAGTRVFHWNDGSTSTFSFDRALNNVAGQITVTFTGTITAGRFAGDTAVEQAVFVTPSALQCLAPPGITALGPGPVVLTIAQP